MLDLDDAGDGGMGGGGMQVIEDDNNQAAQGGTGGVIDLDFGKMDSREGRD